MVRSATLLPNGERPPKSLFGFDVVDFIGQGAASNIYIVTHPATGQVYALKHVVRKNEKYDRFFEQLQAEYDVGRQVQYAGLRRSYELLTTKTLFRKITEAALLLELFDGLPLDERMTKTLAATVDVFVQTGKALQALHQMGYVHCDLKPNNILVSASGQAKVIDLGQACKIGTAKERIQGTPDYIAPEQVKLQPVTTRTDVFNLGATMYWALTQTKLPTLYTIRKKENSFLLDDRIKSPRDLNPQVPKALSELVMECVRTNPAKRPGSLLDLIRRLEEIHQEVRVRRGGDPSDSGRYRNSAAGARA